MHDKHSLNVAFRAGLGGSADECAPYRVPTRRMGLRLGINLDHALGLAAVMQDEEMLRKLELPK